MRTLPLCYGVPRDIFTSGFRYLVIRSFWPRTIFVKTVYLVPQNFLTSLFFTIGSLKFVVDCHETATIKKGFEL